jgi:hypothetical protein
LAGNFSERVIYVSGYDSNCIIYGQFMYFALYMTVNFRNIENGTSCEA